MSPSRTAIAATVLAGLISAAACGAPPGDAEERSRADEDATEIVLLGTTHFAGSALDEYSSEIGDILSDRRQAELETAAGSIARWSPDRFFLECTPDREGRVDSLYRAYRSGAYDPTAAGDRDEIRQLGFRAARKADLDDVGCVDAEGLWLGERARRVARQHNPELLAELDSIPRDETDYLRNHTLSEFLVHMNSDSLLYRNHESYIEYYVRFGTFDGVGVKTRREGDLGGRSFVLAGKLGGLRPRVRRQLEALGAEVDTAVSAGTDYLIAGAGAGAAAERARDLGVTVVAGVDELQAFAARHTEVWVGFPDHHIGADLVGEWYKRNLRIYANLWRALEPDDDRVVLLIGQGHVWTLRQFFRENPHFRVVPVDRVL